MPIDWTEMSLCIASQLRMRSMALSEWFNGCCPCQRLTGIGVTCKEMLYVWLHVSWTDSYIEGITISGAVKRNFRPQNRRYTSPKENFEYGYPILMHFSTFIAKSIIFNTKCKLRQQHKTTTLSNRKRFYAWVGSPTVYRRIFTLVDNFLSCNHFGPTRFSHAWPTIAHATLPISDVTDNWSSWLVDVTFDWCHVMVTAVERKNQTRRLLNFLRRLLIKTLKILNKNDVKIKHKYKRWIPFFWGS